jgi:hypothetical protein
MIIWQSDTCNCIIEFNPGTMKITKIIQECNTHSHSIGSNFIGSSSQLHNKTVNQSVTMSATPTAKEKADLAAAKQSNFKI